MTQPDRHDLLERDVREHAIIITELTKRLNDYDKAFAVMEVEDEFREKRLDAIEQNAKGVHRLGWWVLTTFGATFIAAAANFIARGGLFLGK